MTGDAWPDSPGVSYGPHTFHSTPSPATPLTNGIHLKTATSKEIGLNVATQKSESEHGTPPRGNYCLVRVLGRGASIACRPGPAVSKTILYSKTSVINFLLNNTIS